jgi:histidinol-phosphate aminotransferase
MTGLVPVRSDLAGLTGYHSLQVAAQVRLNANESPLPPPPAWLEELRSELDSIDFNRYPDRRALALRQALAELHGVSHETVFCANGSNEVLQCLLLAFGGPGRRVALFEPTYTLHSHIAALTATGVESAWRKEDYSLDLAAVDALVESVGPVITFLCSPNNPTGRAEPPEVVAHLLERVPGLLVVDEAYGQFAPASALELRSAGAPRAERLVVVRTFSKTWSMAACRLGYLVADPEVVQACESVVLPYHLDAITQVAGQLALRHVEAMEERVALVKNERRRVAAALSELAVRTWPSDANFILFRPMDRPARSVWNDLLGSSVLVRDCSTWRGLSECLRVTVGTPEENDRFLEALRSSLEHTSERTRA